MSDDPIFSATGLEPKKEWIRLEGGRLCLWELTLATASLVYEYSARPSIDPRGGNDKGEAAIWEIALSCYDGEGSDAKRIWPDEKVHEIRSLPERVCGPLLSAINRLNGKDPTEAEIREDFIRATGERQPSD